MGKQNKELNTKVKIVGVIDDIKLREFLEQTDGIIESYKQYKSEIALYNPMLVQPFPPVIIDISSYGGCTDCGSAILNRMDEMKDMGIKVNTHCSGFAYSMAFIIFVNGEKRTSGEYSKFMNHGTSTGGGYGYVESKKYDMEFYMKCDEQFEKILSKNTKMSKERIENARLRCDWIMRDEAIELGIINYGFEGCQVDVEEVERKFAQGLELSLQTFLQIMEIEDELEGIPLLYMGLREMIATLPKEITEEIREMEEELEERIAEMKVEMKPKEDEDDKEEVVEEEKPKKRKAKVVKEDK